MQSYFADENFRFTNIDGIPLAYALAYLAQQCGPKELGCCSRAVAPRGRARDLDSFTPGDDCQVSNKRS